METNSSKQKKSIWILIIAIVLVIGLVVLLLCRNGNDGSTNSNPKSSVNSETEVKDEPVSLIQNNSEESESDAAVMTQKKKEMDGAVAFFIERPDMSDNEMANQMPFGWIYFEKDELEVSADGMGALKAVVRHIQNRPEITIRVVGVHNFRGSTEYVQKLSEKRAEKVADKLIKEFGIPADRLEVVGMGRNADYGLFDYK